MKKCKVHQLASLRRQRMQCAMHRVRGLPLREDVIRTDAGHSRHLIAKRRCVIIE